MLLLAQLAIKLGLLKVKGLLSNKKYIDEVQANIFLLSTCYTDRKHIDYLHPDPPAIRKQ